MATLHQQYTDFNSKLCLSDARRESLRASRRDLRSKIRKDFRENHDEELQPRFAGQGSFMMDTIINPIPVTDASGNKIIKYDLDDGIYFIEKAGESNRQTIETWHDWVYASVDGHTSKPPERHNACVRVIFADGHHIDLPIYYKLDDQIELAHRVDRWTVSDPREFYRWFNGRKNKQLERMVRYLKGWKDFKENRDSYLDLPNGLPLTILGANHYSMHDNDDAAFRKMVRAILDELSKENGFKCLRPTTPKDEDLFAKYSASKKSTFLSKLEELVEACEEAEKEKSQRRASELLREHFGDRFPLGAETDDEGRSKALAAAMGGASISPVPFSHACP